jgi:hypothetical protein
MNQRRPWTGPPNLVFTSDFHQLVRGRLARGVNCTIAYDPRRSASPESYRFGSSDVTFTAHVQTRTGGPVQEVPLVSHAGTMDYVPTTRAGIGPMLAGSFHIPEDAEWITIWVACKSPDGRVWYDSNYGANYTFRFTREDLELRGAEVRPGPGGAIDYLWCSVAASSEVDRVIMRYRVVNTREQTQDEVERELQRTSQTDKEGHIVWETPEITVPHDAVVAFDLVYFVGGDRFKDDNRGHYYLAAKPAAMSAVYLPHSH